MLGKESQGMYPMKSRPDGGPSSAYVASANFISQRSDAYLRWHHKLGHPSNRILKQVLKSCNERVEINESYVCEACQHGKSKFLPFSPSNSRAKAPLDLIHTDIWGPSPVQSRSGHRFYILFVDDYSRFTWLFPLKFKSETSSVFQVFQKQVENQFNTKIKVIQCDNGVEYKPLIPIAQSSGMLIRYTCPYTSVQNGRAERKHRHVVEMGLTLLAQAHMPLTYWTESFQTAAYLINRLPTPTLQGSNPLSCLFQKEPDYKEIQPFGCACYPCLKPYNVHKFQFHSQQCVYLGPAPQHKGHKCLSTIGKIYISRH